MKKILASVALAGAMALAMTGCATEGSGGSGGGDGGDVAVTGGRDGAMLPFGSDASTADGAADAGAGGREGVDGASPDGGVVLPLLALPFERRDVRSGLRTGRGLRNRRADGCV